MLSPKGRWVRGGRGPGSDRKSTAGSERDSCGRGRGLRRRVVGRLYETREEETVWYGEGTHRLKRG